MKVTYELFSSRFSPKKGTAAAAEFASGLDPLRLISISEGDNGVLTVWYWE